jgi:conjugative transfer region lipoprotein (TIGR03751 family)
MRPMQTLWLILINLVVIVNLAGCASGRAPQQGPTMAEVYKDAMAESDGESLDKIREPMVYSGLTDVSGYTRTAQNEINNLFQPLPNPQLVMYIYPHMVAEDEAPIPGYTTAFYLFKQDHFAMPGEVSL